MGSESSRASRRELAVVLLLAFGGIAVMFAVAFTPWYESVLAAWVDPSGAVAHVFIPVPVAALPPAP